MHYLMFYEFMPDYLERRGAFRAEHLALACRALERVVALERSVGPEGRPAHPAGLAWRAADGER